MEVSVQFKAAGNVRRSIFKRLANVQSFGRHLPRDHLCENHRPISLWQKTYRKRSIKEKARQSGFFLAGVTTPEPPPHYSTFENWLAQGHHGTMDYLANDRSRTRRADPREILPECKSILVLATPYSSPVPTRAGRGKQSPPTLGVMTITISCPRG